jgi:hypothetical protein
MDFDILEQLGKIAGIAGITVGAVVIVFSGIIQKKIFPGLTKEQGYRIIKMIILFAGLLAVIGIGAWIYTDYQKNKIDKTNQLKVKHVVGFVKDIDGLPVTSVNIEIAQYPEIIDYSDQDGKFVVKVNGTGKKYIDLVLKHKSYKLVRKKVKIDFDNEVDEIELKEFTLITAFPPDQEGANSGNTSQPRNNNNGSTPSNTGNRNNALPVNSLAAITLNYMGDDYGCALNLEITIGNHVIIPTSNAHMISGLTPGYNSYTIHGNIDCGDFGSCLADGQDQLYVENGADYYVMWLYETCEIAILTESEFQTTISVQ